MKRHLWLLILIGLSMSPLRAQDFPASSGRFQPISLDNVPQITEQNVLGFGLLNDIAWSPNGKTIAVASSTGLTLYDSQLTDTVPQRRLSLSDDSVSLVTFSPDGKWLAAYDQGGSETSAGINIWDLASRDIIASIPNPGSGVALVFSPDSGTLALEEPYNQASLWDIRRLPAVQPLAADRWLTVERKWYLLHNASYLPPNEQSILGYSPTGTLIALPNVSGTVDILDVMTGSRETTTMPISAGSPLFSPNGKLLFWTISTGQNTEIHIWDIDADQEAFSTTHLLISFAFHPFASQMLFATGDGDLWLWDSRTRQQHIILGYEQQSTAHAVLSVAFAPNRPLVAVARVNHIELWNTALGVKQGVITANDDDHHPINRIAFSPDGSLIASAGDDGFARVWDAYTLQQVASMQHDFAVRDVTFSPDGRWLATYSAVADTANNLGSNGIFLWRISTVVPSTVPIAAKDAAARIYSNYFPYYDNNSYRVRFSPNGKILALTGGGVELWDVSKVESQGLNADSKPDLSKGLISVLNNAAGPLVWSPDNIHLVTGNSDQSCNFFIWDVKTQDDPVCATGVDGVITDFAFNPSGDVLATSSSGTADGSGDNALRLWNATTGELLTTFTAESEDIWSVAFSPDGMFLASGSGCANCSSDNYSRDGVVRLWSTSTG